MSSHRREMMALNVGGLQVCIFSCGSDFVCLCDICVRPRWCNRRHVCLPIGHALVGMGILLATSPLRCAHGPRVPYELNARLCACVINSRGHKADFPVRSKSCHAISVFIDLQCSRDQIKSRLEQEWNSPCLFLVFLIFHERNARQSACGVVSCVSAYWPIHQSGDHVSARRISWYRLLQQGVLRV